VNIHVGFDLRYQCSNFVPMIFMLNVHPSRAHDLVTPDRLRISPTRTITPSSKASEISVFVSLRRPANCILPETLSSLTAACRESAECRGNVEAPKGFKRSARWPNCEMSL
jgi:hypothetical protein